MAPRACGSVQRLACSLLFSFVFALQQHQRDHDTAQVRALAAELGRFVDHVTYASRPNAMQLQNTQVPTSRTTDALSARPRDIPRTRTVYPPLYHRSGGPDLTSAARVSICEVLPLLFFKSLIIPRLFFLRYRAAIEYVISIRLR